MKILVSACLLGVNCKYSGGNNFHPEVLALKEKHTLIPLCPEQLGGLSTPRPPAERKGDQIITQEGKDVTDPYQKGAEELLRLARLLGAELAILKARSPACGPNGIYNGTFSHTLIPGQGIAAQALLEAGIPVHSEDEISQLHLTESSSF